jgi:hypothetical protein
MIPITEDGETFWLYLKRGGKGLDN